MVCSTCASIFSGDRSILWDEGTNTSENAGTYAELRRCEAASSRPLHSNTSQLCRGVLHGCHICDIVWRHFFKDTTPQEFRARGLLQKNHGVQVFSKTGTSYRLKEYELPGTRLSEGTIEIEICLNSPMDKHIPIYKTIILAPIENKDHLPILSTSIPGPSVYSHTTLATISEWIKKCSTTHTKCNAEAEKLWYPTRLLKIRNSYGVESAEDRVLWLAQLVTGAKYPIDVQLIETESSPPEGRYMTLSHRWNDSITIQTGTQNVERIKQRFPAHWLSPTFLEAITLAFTLGVQYIWIDSLCIIQDDADDWGSEALTMGKVYAHGILNLSATAAGRGLYTPRSPSLIRPCIVYPSWTGIESRPCMILDSQFWGYRIQRSPCGVRGWIVQERWLSKRVLHFAFDQLVWECRDDTMSETHPLGLPKEISRYGRRDFKSQTTALAKGEGQITTESLMHRDWRNVLDTYGRAELTVEADKLVAISGIAESFASALDDTWVAGLWKRTIPGDLLWRVPKSRRSNKPKLPSTPDHLDQSWSSPVL